MTPETGAAGKAYVPQDPQGAVMRRKSPQGGADRIGPEDKSTTTRQTSAAEVIDRSDRLWFKRAIIYEAHVKAFFDANDDGIGDFTGFARKLDYLKDLGITAIW